MGEASPLLFQHLRTLYIYIALTLAQFFEGETALNSQHLHTLYIYIYIALTLAQFFEGETALNSAKLILIYKQF